MLSARVAQSLAYKNSTEPECPALAPLQNGSIAYGPDFTPDFEVDTVATYSCDPGFRLSGTEIRSCLDTERWSGQPPVCMPTYVRFVRF